MFCLFFNLLLMVCVPITPNRALGCLGKAPIKRVQRLELIWKSRWFRWSKSEFLRFRPVMDIRYWGERIRKRRIILTAARRQWERLEPAPILLYVWSTPRAYDRTKFKCCLLCCDREGHKLILLSDLSTAPPGVLPCSSLLQRFCVICLTWEG